MDTAAVAARLMAAEREYRQAQLQLKQDGSNAARARYAKAAAELGAAESAGLQAERAALK